MGTCSAVSSQFPYSTVLYTINNSTAQNFQSSVVQNFHAVQYSAVRFNIESKPASLSQYENTLKNLKRSRTQTSNALENKQPPKARIPKPSTSKADVELRFKFARLCKPRHLKRVDLWVDQWFHAIPLSHTVPRSPKAWRRDKHKLKAWAVKPNPKFKAPGVRLLAGFSKGAGGRPAKLIFSTPYKKLNQTSAISLWKRVILPALKKHYPEKGAFLVQQDGDGALNANAVRDSLRAMGVTIAFRGGSTGPEAPARFCDFWPVETVWANRQTAVRKMIQKSKKWRKGVGLTATQKQLKAWGKSVLGVVRRVKGAFLQSLHDGMPKRIKMLRDAKGGPIKK